MLSAGEGLELLHILGELGAADRFGRTGEVPASIADGEADGLRADVEAGELPAWNGGRELARVGRDQRRHAATLRSASPRIAPQKSA